MANVKFENFTIEVAGLIDKRINAVLEECSAELESQVKQNSRVDTGKTKSSFTHYVDGPTHTAYIGSPDENAIWEEFGTGEYALGGNGRKGGWVYKNDKDGKFYHTYGKTPSRAFFYAYTALKSSIINYIQNSLKGL